MLGFMFVVMGITFVQQRRTERSLEALRDMSSPQALVLRDRKTRKVVGRELVCGDRSAAGARPGTAGFAAWGLCMGT